LVELNIQNSVRSVCASTIVQAAWARKQELSIHAWVYRLSDGLIRTLSPKIESQEGLDQIYRLSIHPSATTTVMNPP
jgi:carbonic anhydrase